jgi:Coproporphyrinogen III oxidase and related Fe-S oxidoreductases
MIYIHVPFCRSFCTYCGFYSEICSRRDPQQVQNRIMEDYVDAILDEIASRREEIAAARGSDPAKPGAAALQAPDTLYIGGGTPSVLAVPMLERIVRALGPATYGEFTVEVNPDDVAAGGASYAAALRALGVNRISMGVQSFDDDVLRWMNRRHNAAGAREAFRLLRSAGFDNVSIDLIFGLSQLSDELWERTVGEALALRPEHISAYQLSVEPDSVLAELVASGRYAEASDERCRRQYDTLCRLLAAAGYVHYEVSNWALPGREAVHNSAYWRRVPYVGLGPSAHSLSFPSTAGTASPTAVPGVRSWNGSELARRGADGCLLRWHAEQEILSGREAAEEAIMLALRTARGLPLAQLRALSPSAPVDDLLAAGALRLIPVAAASDGPWVRIPEDRFFVSDDIISRLFPEG